MQAPVDRPDPIDGFSRDGITSDLYESAASRLRPVLKRGVIILVAAAIVTVAFGLLGYRPLRGGAPGAVAGATVTATGDRFDAAFAPGGTFEYSFAVRNDGRWGVTITGMQAPAHGAFGEVEVLATTQPSTVATTFDSFELAAGETATLTVRVTFGSCETPPPVDARPIWSQEIVHYRVMGVARQMVVDLPFSLAIDSATAVRC